MIRGFSVRHNMNQSEEIAVAFLKDRGLFAERFGKSEIREPGVQTPDFRVFKDGKFEFFCEVKETTDADPLENHFHEVEEGIFVAEQLKIGDRSRHYRIAKKVHKAVKQFDSVNSDLVHPNVLLFVNTDEMCVPSYLTELLIGYLPTDSCGLRICTSPTCARDQITNDRLRVHLFVWLHRVPQDKPYNELFFWDKHEAQTDRLRLLFQNTKARKKDGKQRHRAYSVNPRRIHVKVHAGR